MEEVEACSSEDLFGTGVNLVGNDVLKSNPIPRGVASNDPGFRQPVFELAIIHQVDKKHKVLRIER